MEKLIPYEKLSKKEQRKQNARRRGSWGAINPVTRKSENPRAYNRRKARRLEREERQPDLGAFSLSCKLSAPML